MVLLTSRTHSIIDLIYFILQKRFQIVRSFQTLHSLQRPAILHQFPQIEALPNRQVVPKYSVVHVFLYYAREIVYSSISRQRKSYNASSRYSRLQKRLHPLSLKKIMSTDHLIHFWRWLGLPLSSHILQYRQSGNVADCYGSILRPRGQYDRVRSQAKRQSFTSAPPSLPSQTLQATQQRILSSSGSIVQLYKFNSRLSLCYQIITSCCSTLTT